MHTSPVPLAQNRPDVSPGYHAVLIEYLASREESELVNAPSLALLYGTARARLGHLEAGRKWLEIALRGARRRGEQGTERRALNALGAIALVNGEVEEAAARFAQGLLAASRDGDVEMVGRCSANMGVASHLSGRGAEAIGSWQLALAAFERAGRRKDVAACHHNLGIAFREQGALERALAEADRAVAESGAARDRGLWATALRARAETRVVRSELDLARHDLDQLAELRSRSPDSLARAEDLRVEAALLAALGRRGEAERLLREVIDGFEAQLRPALLAAAHRDLAALLSRAGRGEEAARAAHAALRLFIELGATGEIRRLRARRWSGEIPAELTRSVEPLPEAQALADAGRYDELVDLLGSQAGAALEESPLLALLSGIGHSRLGRLETGHRWAAVALSRARLLGDRALEVRALNVCGAIALQQGGIDAAMQLFAHAQGPPASRHPGARAVPLLRVAARRPAPLRGTLEGADAAVRVAERNGDRRRMARALTRRAQTRLARGEPILAVVDLQRALAAHRELHDEVHETEILRLLALALDGAGKSAQAEEMLREVVSYARAHGPFPLAVKAERDLALLTARRNDRAAPGMRVLPAREVATT